jgi:hypothetical protein
MEFKHGNLPDSKFIPTQLRKGIKVEMEHTRNRSVAKQIAKAHLVENPRYYTYLEKMEKSWKQTPHVRVSKYGRLFAAGKGKARQFLEWQRKNRKTAIQLLDKSIDPRIRALNATFKVEDAIWDKVLGGKHKKRVRVK